MDTSGLDRETQVEVARLPLLYFEDQVWRFECDIPWSRADSWPPHVREAASLLTELSTRKRNDDVYAATGVLEFEPEAWEAFITFAPYAFDATAWLDPGGEVSLADEVQGGFAIQVTDEELESVSALIGEVGDVPIRRRGRRVN